MNYRKDKGMGGHKEGCMYYNYIQINTFSTKKKKRSRLHVSLRKCELLLAQKIISFK